MFQRSARDSDRLVLVPVAHTSWHRKVQLPLYVILCMPWSSISYFFALTHRCPFEAVFALAWHLMSNSAPHTWPKACVGPCIPVVADSPPSHKAMGGPVFLHSDIVMFAGGRALWYQAFVWAMSRPPCIQTPSGWIAFGRGPQALAAERTSTVGGVAGWGSDSGGCKLTGRTMMSLRTLGWGICGI